MTEPREVAGKGRRAMPESGLIFVYSRDNPEPAKYLKDGGKWSAFGIFHEEWIPMDDDTSDWRYLDNILLRDNTIDALKAEGFHWVKDRLPETVDGELLLAKSDRVRPCVVSRQGVIEQWQSLFSAWCRLPTDEEEA